jgi:four helix bundle protein
LGPIWPWTSGGGTENVNSISISISIFSGWSNGAIRSGEDGRVQVGARASRAVDALIKAANTRGFADLIGQLRRSTASIPANILESAGEWRTGKRVHYLMIAKGSTWESWAHTDSMVDFGLVPKTAIAEVRDAQGQITALLISTIRNLEAQLAEEEEPPPPCPAPPI